MSHVPMKMMDNIAIIYALMSDGAMVVILWIRYHRRYVPQALVVVQNLKGCINIWGINGARMHAACIVVHGAHQAKAINLLYVLTEICVRSIGGSFECNQNGRRIQFGRMYSLGEVNFIQGMHVLGNCKNSVGLKPNAEWKKDAKAPSIPLRNNQKINKFII